MLKLPKIYLYIVTVIILLSIMQILVQIIINSSKKEKNQSIKS